MYQSVLSDLEWGDISASPFLTALRQQSREGRLSIKFNVDGFNMDPTSPDFTRGRIVGTRHLGQAELGPVGTFPHELGIDGYELGVGQRLAERRQLVGLGDQLH